MKSQKILSLILGITLVATALVYSSPISASELRNVRGYVYVDGEIIAPTQVTVIFPEQQKTAQIPGDPVGYYAITLNVAHGQTGYFLVTFAAQTYQADETLTIQAGVINYLNVNLTIDTEQTPVNTCPAQPTNPSPPHGAPNLPTTVTLSVDVFDADGDTLTVSFYDASDDSLIGTDMVPGSGTASVTWTGLSKDKTYSWYAVSDDGVCSVSSNTWSFRTAANGIPPSPPTTPPGPPSEPPTPPVAVPGGPYTGFVGEEINFNGSLSYHPEGRTIVSWHWDFGDGATGSGETTTHTYLTSKTYAVNLTVTDDIGETDTNTTWAVIIVANQPPTTPTLYGPSNGTRNTSYEYSAVSTDPDNDTIQYTFTWGDGQTTVTEFLPNGTAAVQTHQWEAAGRYEITVRAFDNKTVSGLSSLFVLIDGRYVGDLGYLLDTDGDGIYDVFYSNTTEQQNPVEYRDGKYYIDIDGNGVPDYVYDPLTDTYTTYPEAQPPREENMLHFYILFGILILLVLVLFALVLRKKKTPPPPPPPPVEPATQTKPAPKKKTTKKTGKKTK